MTKIKKKLTKEDKLAKDRIRKRQKYEEIKNNPELYKIQKEKERMRYLEKKKKKKICSIKDMSARAQREQRKRWRKNSQDYLKRKQKQKELIKILVDNSPPDSEDDSENVPELQLPDDKKIMEQDPLALTVKSESNPEKGTQKCKVTHSSSLRKFRYKAKKTINRLQAEIEKINREKELLRKKTKKLQETLKQKTFEDTLEKKVNAVVKDIQGGKVEEVKKKLLFDETLSKGLTTKYKSLNKTDKRNFAEEIVLPNRVRLAKHKLLCRVPFSIRQKLQIEQKTRVDKKKRQIESFFEDDLNSRVAAGKNEYIKKGDVKKQKRYLNDNLKNLHAKYCRDQDIVSYSVFCKYRPYWVVFPKDERDTCQCKLHANVNLLIKALKKYKITSEGSATDILNSLCCDPYDENCLARSCDDCKGKTLIYMEFNNSENIDYFEWIIEKQNYRGKDGKQKVKMVTTKKRKSDNPKNIIQKLDNIMKTFYQHVRNIVMQHSAIKALKNNLTETEVLLHVDFSENYSFKFHEEVQSYHFGGSRGQVSLHTVVMYYLDNEKRLCTKSVCTMSQDVTHNASAIWAHIIPLLNTAKQLVPHLAKVHFLSDSPSSQYRNRFIFYMITKLHLQVPTVTTVTWNYQESGHGKGAPDGIGAVIKRTADNYVKFGGDVGTFEVFVNLIREKVEGVEVSVISEDDINRKKFPALVPGFKGTTKVHQALWSSELPYSVALRSLSCFTCLNSYLPCDHQRHIGMLNIGFGQTTITDHSVTNLIEDTLLSPQPDVCVSDFQNLEMDTGLNSADNDQTDNNLCDFEMGSDTFNNNTQSNMILSEFDGTLFLNETIPMEITPPNNREKERPRILSNVLLDCQSLLQVSPLTSESEIRRKRKTVPKQDYERFLKSSKIIKFNTVVEMKETLEEGCASIKRGFHSIGTEDEDVNNKENTIDVEAGELKYNLDNWVIVKYNINKNKSHFVYYVGKIMEKLYNTGEYKIGFLKKSQGKTMKFSWPLITDEDIVPESRIVHCLSEPNESRRGQLSFDDLPKFSFK